MAEGFFARDWRIWEDADKHGMFHLTHKEQEIVFHGRDFTILVELIVRMDNADFIDSARVHSTEED